MMKDYYIYKEGWLWVCEVCVRKEVLDRFIGNTPTKALENALNALNAIV